MACRGAVNDLNVLELLINVMSSWNKICNHQQIAFRFLESFDPSWRRNIRLVILKKRKVCVEIR